MFNLISSAPRRASTVSALLLGSALVTLTGCSDDALPAPRAVVNLPTVTLTPGSVTLRPGGTQQLSAAVKNSAGQDISGANLIWSTADSLIARVSASGLVTVRAPGVAGITARYQNVQGVANVTVLGPIAGITLTAPLASLTVGNTVQLTARALDGSGIPQPREITYTSSAPTVFTVTAAGVATAVGPGTAIITATSEGRTATVNLTATPFIPVDRLTLSLGTTPVGVGGTVQAAVATLAADGTNLGRPVTYTTSAAAVATVSATGLVSVVGPGTATITASSEGKSATATVTSLIESGTSYVISGPGSMSERSFFINVPTGSTSVLVTLSGGTGDPDLFVFRTGSATAACSSEADGPMESCNVATTGVAGLYRVRVLGFSAYSGTTLRATVTP